MIISSNLETGHNNIIVFFLLHKAQIIIFKKYQINASHNIIVVHNASFESCGTTNQMTLIFSLEPCGQILFK